LWRHEAVAIAEKDWPSLPAADAQQQVAERRVIDEWDDPGFSAFPLADDEPFACDIAVVDSEVAEFSTPHAQPPQGIDQAAIAQIGRGEEQFPHVSRFEVIG
jgi:hypothetical protein